MGWSNRLFMGVDLFFVGQHVYLIGLGQYSKCSAPIGHAVAMMLLCLFFQLLGVELSTSDRYKKCGQNLLIYGLLASLISTYFGLSCLIIVFTKSSNCLPMATSNFDAMMVFMYSFIYTILMVFITYFLVKLWYQKKKLAEESTKMYEEYPKLLQPRFDITAFMKKHEVAIEKNPIQEKDIALLNDFCTSKFTGQGEQAHRNECVICLSEFNVDNIIITHPKCEHLYHPECVIGWFQKSNQEGKCPVCREYTRKELLNLIAQRKLAPVYRAPSEPQPALPPGHSQA